MKWTREMRKCSRRKLVIEDTECGSRNSRSSRLRTIAREIKGGV